MEKYPQFKHSWPILAGYNILNGEYGQHIIVIFKDTGNPNIRSSGVISFDFSSLGIFSIDGSNIETVRQQVRAEHRGLRRARVQDGRLLFQGCTGKIRDGHALSPPPYVFS